MHPIFGKSKSMVFYSSTPSCDSRLKQKFLNISIFLGHWTGPNPIPVFIENLIDTCFIFKGCFFLRVLSVFFRPYCDNIVETNNFKVLNVHCKSLQVRSLGDVFIYYLKKKSLSLWFESFESIFLFLVFDVTRIANIFNLL